jgi:hypothetical protein
MNQQAMEQALGKLIIDGDFRDAFFRDPTVASEAAGISLSDPERKALTRIRPGALATFQRYLDAKRVGDCRWRQAHDVEDSYDTCLTRRES